MLFLEVMTLWGGIHPSLPAVLTIAPATNREIVRTGDLLLPGANMHHCRMYRAANFRRLLEDIGLQIELMFTSGVLSTNWEEQLREIPEDSAAWQHLLEMELEASREPGCLDMGTHLVAVCQKG
jgi:hypothetical protein